MRSLRKTFGLILLAAAFAPLIAAAQAPSTTPPKGKGQWKPVPFAIVHFNEEAPKSWNLYFCSKRGVLLLRLWKRYLLIDRNAQQVFDVDPEKIVAKGEEIEFSFEDNPSQPADITDWRERNIGTLHRLRFRFGEKGSYLDIQTPLKQNGTPLY